MTNLWNELLCVVCILTLFTFHSLITKLSRETVILSYSPAKTQSQQKNPHTKRIEWNDKLNERCDNVCSTPIYYSCDMLRFKNDVTFVEINLMTFVWSFESWVSFASKWQFHVYDATGFSPVESTTTFLHISLDLKLPIVCVCVRVDDFPNQRCDWSMEQPIGIAIFVKICSLSML